MLRRRSFTHNWTYDRRKWSESIILCFLCKAEYEGRSACFAAAIASAAFGRRRRVRPEALGSIAGGFRGFARRLRQRALESRFNPAPGASPAEGVALLHFERSKPNANQIMTGNKSGRTSVNYKAVNIMVQPRLATIRLPVRPAFAPCRHTWNACASGPATTHRLALPRR